MGRAAIFPLVLIRVRITHQERRLLFEKARLFGAFQLLSFPHPILREVQHNLLYYQYNGNSLNEMYAQGGL